MRQLGRIVPVIFIVLPLVGCGRSGRARVPVVGDSAAYTVSGTLTAPNGMSVPVSGEATYSVAPSTGKAQGAAAGFSNSFEVRQSLTLEIMGRRQRVANSLERQGEDKSKGVFLLADSDDGTHWDPIKNPSAAMVNPPALNSSSA